MTLDARALDPAFVAEVSGAAYDVLPAALQAKIEDLWAEHWLWHWRMLAGYPEPTQAERQAKPATAFEDTVYRRDMRRTTVYDSAV